MKKLLLLAFIAVASEAMAQDAQSVGCQRTNFENYYMPKKAIMSGRETAEILLLVGRLVQKPTAMTGELSPAQWMALRFFARADSFSRTPSAFAEFQATTRGTASQAIKTLEAGGYLVRQRSQADGRSAILAHTKVLMCSTRSYSGQHVVQSVAHRGLLLRVERVHGAHQNFERIARNRFMPFIRQAEINVSFGWGECDGLAADQRRSRGRMRTTSSWQPRSTAYSLARPRGERVLGLAPLFRC